MAERRVKVTFAAEVQNFVAAMKAAARATEEAKKASEGAGEASEKASETSTAAAKKAAQAQAEHRDAVEKVGTTAMVAGAATLAGVGLAIKTYADFDKQMSSVKAATHETAGNMDLLKQAAIEAGADTSFSAKEAAQGIEELAKAGVATKDIIGGGLKGSLDLAAAGSLGVGEAAEIAASALTQFKLEGSDVPHIADLLAAGAGKAQGSVQDMGAALNQVGLVAAQTGLTIEETTGGLAAFASAGLTGSDAGTSFKTMLAALTPNSEAASKAMDELGISAYDSQGNFVGLSEFAGQLRDSLSGLTDEQRNSTLETIFGSDAVRAAAVLYEQGAEGVQKWEDAVNDAGYAAQTAATMQDNLAGDLEKLGGSFDTVLLQSGSGANEVLRGLVQGAEDLVDAIGKIPAPVLQAGVGIAGVAGGMALLGGAVMTALPKIRDGIDAFQKLEKSAPRAASALKGASIASAIIGIGLALGEVAEAKAGDQIERSVGKTTAALVDMSKKRGNIEEITSALDHLFNTKNGDQLVAGVDSLDSALTRMFKKDFFQSANDWGNDMAKALSLGSIDFGTMKTLEDSFKTIDDQLASFVESGNADLAANSFSKIEESARAQGVSLEQLKTAFPGYFEALKQSDADAQVAAEGMDKITTSAGQVIPVTEEVAEALADIGLSASGAVTDLVKFTDALINAGLLQISARDAARGLEAAIDAVSASVAENGTTLDITTEKGRANQSALDAVASAGLRVVQANAANGASQATLQGNLNTTYQRLMESAGQFGITGGKADELARKIMGIPPGVSVQSWMSSAAKSMAEQTGAAVSAVDGRTANVYVNTYRTEFHRVVRSESVSTGTGPRRDGQRDAFATGGRIKGYADGGQLPTTGPGTDVTDGFLGISSLGMPIARVDAGEWIINGRSSDRYNRELAAINAGTFPKLPGYADGGRAGRDAAAMAAAAPAAISITVHSSVHLGKREFAQAVSDVQRTVVTRN